MRTRTVTVREGEYLGPVDWDYDFASAEDGRMNHVDERVALFREMAGGVERGETWQATTDGGWPRIGWHQVLTVGMYDGWPYWRPVPSFCTCGPLGPEWHSWGTLTGAERVDG